jgi:hypothetical protein
VLPQSILKNACRTPGFDDLQAGTPVRLLAKLSNRIVAVACFHGFEEKTRFVLGRNRKFSERLVKTGMVKLASFFD